MIFLEANGVPIVLEMNKDPSNHASLVKIFNGVGTKVGSAGLKTMFWFNFCFCSFMSCCRKTLSMLF
jgi:hypothetical protein